MNIRYMLHHQLCYKLSSSKPQPVYVALSAVYSVQAHLGREAAGVPMQCNGGRPCSNGWKCRLPPSVSSLPAKMPSIWRCSHVELDSLCYKS